EVPRDRRYRLVDSLGLHSSRWSARHLSLPKAEPHSPFAYATVRNTASLCRDPGHLGNRGRGTLRLRTSCQRESGHLLESCLVDGALRGRWISDESPVHSWGRSCFCARHLTRRWRRSVVC